MRFINFFVNFHIKVCKKFQLNGNFIVDDSEDPNVEIITLECDAANGVFTFTKSGVTTTIDTIECYSLE